MVFTYALLFTLAAASSILLTPLVRRLALRLGAVDVPDERRVHTRTTPRLGGLAVYASVVFSFGIAMAVDAVVLEIAGRPRVHLGPLAAGATLIVALGAVDDVRSLPARTKLLVQCLAAVLVVAGGLVVGQVMGVRLGAWGIPLTLLWIVGVTNALNLIDGLDGLAAGVGLIVAATIFAVSVSAGQPGEAMVLAALAGALVGFLRYNFHPARIFLGDSGSLFLGFVLAVVSITASTKPETVVAFTVPLVALGLPIADTLLAVVRRMLRAVHVVRSDPAGEHYEFLFLGKAAIFTADRDHIHHRLLRLGISQRRAVLVLYAVCALFGAGAFTLVLVREPNQGLLLGAFAVAAIVGIRRLDYGELQVLRRGTLLPIFHLPIANWALMHVFADLAFVLLAHFAAFWVASGGAWTPALREACTQSLAPVALVQIAVLAATGLYRVSLSLATIDDLLLVSRSVFFAVLAGWLAQSVALGFALPGFRTAILGAYFLATLVIGSRLLFPLLDHLFKRHRDDARRALIYGTGRSGLAALHEIENDASLDLKVVGFVDNDPRGRPGLIGGRRIYSPDDLYDLALRQRFDELVIADPAVEEHLLADLTRLGPVLRTRRFSLRWETLDVPASAKGNGDAASRRSPLPLALHPATPPASSLRRMSLPSAPGKPPHLRRGH